jgi:hypothetical protein
MSFIEASEVELGEVVAKYYQSQDSCSLDNYPQVLTIKTDDAGSGKFFIISTERWTFSDIGEMIATLEDFKKRSGIG